VWARSQIGKGTSFVLRLRRLEQAAGGPSLASPSARTALAAAGEVRVGNILVCDDERSICELLDIACAAMATKSKPSPVAKPPSAKSTVPCST